MSTLYTKLMEYGQENVTAMHMPGHKRGGSCMVNPYQIDITEIEGFDNLHNPTGIIKEEQDRLAKLYGADRAFILVNGSTCGNLSAMYAVLNRGDGVAVQRNAHKSVYNGIEITGAKPSFMNSCDISFDSACELDFAGIKAVVVTSPDYNGYVADIETIARKAHEAGAVLIVDSAHGAHLGFSDRFPRNPIELGADLVVMSLHKTLPALTQTSALLVKGDRIDFDRLIHAIDIFETSSPSYVLMSSASQCMDFLEEVGVTGFDVYADRLQKLYEDCSNLKILEVINDSIAVKDPSKVIISGEAAQVPGYVITEMLRRDYRIEPEMTSKYQVLALTSIVDEESLVLLSEAIRGIDNTLDKIIRGDKMHFLTKIQSKKEQVIERLKKYIGQTSSTMITIYPPGSPLILPGDTFTEQTIRDIGEALAYQLDVTGLPE